MWILSKLSKAFLILNTTDFVRNIISKWSILCAIGLRQLQGNTPKKPAPRSRKCNIRDPAIDNGNATENVAVQ